MKTYFCILTFTFLFIVSLFPYSGLVVHPIKGRLELASNYSEYIKVPFLSIYMLPVVFFFLFEIPL